jgi:drug/metabolite transporter (DMT)-like permease
MQAPVRDASSRRALIEMICGASLISTTSIFVKYAHVGPTVSAFYRMLFGGLILMVWLVASGRWQRIRWREVIWLLIPALAFSSDLFVWHRSILSIGPGLATLLGNFQVFVMALAGWLLYREKLGLHFTLGVLLAFVGLYLLVGLDWTEVSAQYQWGVVLGIASGLAYAVYLLTTRHAQRKGKVSMGSPQWLCVHSLLCALVLGMIVFLEGESFSLPDAQTWWSLIGLAVVGQIVGWILLLRAMPHLQASMIGLLLLLQPAFSFLLDVILFNRVTLAVDWVGVALSLIGIFIGTYRSPAKKLAASSTNGGTA